MSSLWPMQLDYETLDHNDRLGLFTRAFEARDHPCCIRLSLDHTRALALSNFFFMIASLRHLLTLTGC
jgi:hypothetical protein